MIKLIRLTKIRAAGVYSSSVLCDLKNAYKSLSPTMSHNWLRIGHCIWFGNRNTLKCLYFLTGRKLSPAQAVPAEVLPGLSGGTVRLQLRGTRLSAGAFHLEVEGREGPGLLTDAVRLEMEGPEGPRLLLDTICLRLGGLILTGLWKFEKNWYHFVFVSNVKKNVTWNNK